ncbi:MAG: BamA/TamA family outer membrane protein [Candidatus Kryptonium sp.]|nr:BamA/TamA family outer membrane protein [Candidatus Kryptonium sp.]
MKQVYQFLLLLSFFGWIANSQEKLQIKFYDKNGAYHIVNYEIKQPKIALVLSGGGARGLSHIGVLKVFEKYGIKVDCIIGTSMGSIVGGLYSAGLRADEIEKIALTTNWSGIITLGEKEDRSNLFFDRKYLIEKSFIYFRFRGLKPLIPSYVISGQSITEELLKIFLKTPFHYITDYEKLKPRFYTVATDLVTGKRIIFSNGNIVYSVKASSTIPLVFQPVFLDSLVLVDGGLISNIPADVARELGCDIVITVDATSPLRSPQDIQLPWNTADQIVGIMMQLSNKFQIEKSDIVLKPELEGVSPSDFDKVELIIKSGEKVAEEKIDEIISLIESKIKILGDSEERKLSEYRLKLYGDGLPADAINSIICKEVTDKDIVNLLYKILSQGEYARIDVEVHQGARDTEIVFNTKLNPDIKKVNVYPQSSDGFQIDFSRFLGGLFASFEVLDTCVAFYPSNEIYFSERNVYEISREILRIFHAFGYSFATIKKIEFDEFNREINIYLNDGYVSEIKIHGNIKTRNFVIFRDIMFREGEILTERKVLETLRNLWATDLFSQIKLDYIVEDSVRVAIHLQESASQFLRMGLRIDNERGGQFFSDFRNENTFGFNDNFGLTFQGGMRNLMLKLEYKVDRLFQTIFTYKFNLYHSERKVHTYKTILSDRSFSLKNEGEIKFSYIGFDLSAGGQFEKLGNALIRYQVERAFVKNVSRIEFKEERNLLAKLQLNINVDSRDKAYFPNRGVYMNAYYEMSQKFLGSDVAYSKIFFSYENYNTYFKYGALKLKFLFGLCDDSTPLSQQFFIGSVTGLNSFSGMKEDEMYGRQVILGGVEARFRSPIKVFFESFLSLRYDVGSAWEKFEAIRWKDLRQGIGIELGFDTPIGALRINVGKSFKVRAVKQEGLIWGPTIFYFSLGFE